MYNNDNDNAHIYNLIMHVMCMLYYVFIGRKVWKWERVCRREGRGGRRGGQRGRRGGRGGRGRRGRGGGRRRRGRRNIN